MGLVHRRQKPTRLREVSGFGREPGDDRVVEPHPPNGVVQISRQAEGHNSRNIRFDLEPVRLPFVEGRVGVEPRIREQRGVCRVVAEAIVARNAERHRARK